MGKKACVHPPDPFRPVPVNRWDFRRALASHDPNHPELCSLVAVLNLKLVSDLQLAPESTQLHPVFTDVQRVREMALLVSGDPQSHRHDRFGSLRPPFPYAKSRHIPASLRIAVLVVIVVIFFFFAIAFFFFFFFFLFVLVGFLAKEDIGSYRAIRRV
jgi:hypothetical protein